MIQEEKFQPKIHHTELKLKLFYIELSPVSCIIGQGQGLEKDR